MKYFWWNIIMHVYHTSLRETFSRFLSWKLITTWERRGHWKKYYRAGINNIQIKDLEVIHLNVNWNECVVFQEDYFEETVSLMTSLFLGKCSFSLDSFWMQFINIIKNKVNILYKSYIHFETMKKSWYCGPIFWAFAIGVIEYAHCFRGITNYRSGSTW